MTATFPSMKKDNNLEPVPQTYLERAFQGAYTGTNLIYAGFAKPGAVTSGALVWQISKMTYDGSNNLLSVQWPVNANGAVSTEYEFDWALRATYTYV